MKYKSWCWSSHDSIETTSLFRFLLQLVRSSCYQVFRCYLVTRSLGWLSFPGNRTYWLSKRGLGIWSQDWATTSDQKCFVSSAFLVILLRLRWKKSLRKRTMVFYLIVSYDLCSAADAWLWLGNWSKICEWVLWISCSLWVSCCFWTSRPNFVQCWAALCVFLAWFLLTYILVTVFGWRKTVQSAFFW